MGDAIQDEIDLMNKPFVMGDDEVKTDAPATDAPTTDEPKTEPPATDAPDEEFKTDAPETKAPKTEAPTTDAPDERDQTILELRAKLAGKDEAPKTKPPTTTAPLTFEEQDFLKDVNLENLTESPEKFNKLLNSIYQKAITDANKKLSPGIMRGIPDLVTSITNLQNASEKFYSENKDLRTFRKVVATVFDDLIAKEPNKSYFDVMKDVAPEVRKRLELPEPKKPDKKADKNNPPKLPRRKSKPGRSKEPTADSEQDEISKMNESLGR